MAEDTPGPGPARRRGRDRGRDAPEAAREGRGHAEKALEQPAQEDDRRQGRQAGGEQKPARGAAAGGSRPAADPKPPRKRAPRKPTAAKAGVAAGAAMERPRRGRAGRRRAPSRRRHGGAEAGLTGGAPEAPRRREPATPRRRPDRSRGRTGRARRPAAGVTRALAPVGRVLTSRRAPRIRTGVALFLVVVSVLAVLVSTLALWSRGVIFDTETYVKVVAPVAEDPEVREAVSTYVAGKAVEAADLRSRIEDALPSDAKVLAPALTRSLQTFLVDEIDKFLSTPLAQRLWVDINRFAHEQLITALRDQNRYVTVGRNDVKLNLLPLVAVALQRLEAKSRNSSGATSPCRRSTPRPPPTRSARCCRTHSAASCPPTSARSPFSAGARATKRSRRSGCSTTW